MIGLFPRRLDGTSYNKDHVWWGAAMEDVTRDVPAMYADGVAMPAGTCTPEQKQTGSCRYVDEVNGFGSNRPPPRTISNELFRQVRPVTGNHVTFMKTGYVSCKAKER